MIKENPIYNLDTKNQTYKKEIITYQIYHQIEAI